MTANGKGRASWTARELTGTVGPVEVWIQAADGTQVSNVYVIP